MSQANVLLGVVTTAAFLAAVPVPAGQAQQSLQITVDANNLWVRAGQAPVLQYRYGDVPFKPYVKELFTPGGVNVLLDAPSDHLHHHALMFACAVNNVDFWGEAVGPPGGHFEPQPGKQQHVRFGGVDIFRTEPHAPARFMEVVRWVSGSTGEHLLTEERVVNAARVGKPPATVLSWESRLSVPQGKEVTLAGSHYHGLGLRFPRSMDGTGEFRNPDNDPGVVFRGEERLIRSRWCAYTAPANGKTVTVAMFDHPSNVRHPATWFTMAKPFAYLSATLRLHEEPLKLPPSRYLALDYTVVLWDGRPEVAQIDELYKQLTAMPSTK